MEELLSTKGTMGTKEEGNPLWAGPCHSRIITPWQMKRAVRNGDRSCRMGVLAHRGPLRGISRSPKQTRNGGRVHPPYEYLGFRAFRFPRPVRRERVRVRASLTPGKDPHPSPLPAYRAREQSSLAVFRAGRRVRLGGRVVARRKVAERVRQGGPYRCRM